MNPGRGIESRLPFHVSNVRADVRMSLRKFLIRLKHGEIWPDDHRMIMHSPSDAEACELRRMAGGEITRSVPFIRLRRRRNNELFFEVRT